MISSRLTISARFSLIASLIFSLWRCWSIKPLRWSDQSLLVTDPVVMIASLRTAFGKTAFAAKGRKRRKGESGGTQGDTNARRIHRDGQDQQDAAETNGLGVCPVLSCSSCISR